MLKIFLIFVLVLVVLFLIGILCAVIESGRDDREMERLWREHQKKMEDPDD